MSKESIGSTWVAVQRKIVTAWQRRDYKQSLGEIESFLSRRINQDLRSEALGYRAHTKELMGLLNESKEDLSQAQSLSKRSSYSRYTLELSLGSLCEKLDQKDEAAMWYRTALLTSAGGRSYSGGAALRSYLRLQGDDLSEDERALAGRVVRRSWKNLRLPGSPELQDLRKAASILKEKEAQAP